MHMEAQIQLSHSNLREGLVRELNDLQTYLLGLESNLEPNPAELEETIVRLPQSIDSLQRKSHQSPPCSRFQKPSLSLDLAGNIFFSIEVQILYEHVRSFSGIPQQEFVRHLTNVVELGLRSCRNMENHGNRKRKRSVDYSDEIDIEREEYVSDE